MLALWLLSWIVLIVRRVAKFIIRIVRVNRVGLLARLLG